METGVLSDASLHRQRLSILYAHMRGCPPPTPPKILESAYCSVCSPIWIWYALICLPADGTVVLIVVTTEKLITEAHVSILLPLNKACYGYDWHMKLGVCVRACVCLPGRWINVAGFDFSSCLWDPFVDRWYRRRHSVYLFTPLTEHSAHLRTNPS